MTNDIYSGGSRKVTFRYDIIRGLVKIGEADVISCSINYDSEATIKRTAKFTLSHDINFDFLNDKLRAVMISDGTEYALGTFILSTPTLSQDASSASYSAEAYDTTIILKEDCLTERAYFPAGEKYDNIISSILISAGITDYRIPNIDVRLQADREFEIGTPKLEVCNTLLDEANYNPLIADEYGQITTSRYTAPSLATVTRDYCDDELSVISPILESEADFYNVPNVFIACCNNPEMEREYYSVFENNSPSSKLSTVCRGRKIVSEVYKPDCIESPEALDEYVRRKASEASAVFDKLKISTALMPGHGYHDIIHVSCKDISGIYLEKSWSMELKAGALMSHDLVGVYQYDL